MNKKALAAIAASAAAFAAVPAQAALPVYFDVSIEAAGVTETTTTFLDTGAGAVFGIERFDGRSGISTFNTDFGSDGLITGTYNNVNVIPSNQYGGAGNAGDYAVAGLGLTESYSIEFTQTGETGINYFGYWLSALDAGNTVEFWSGGSLLGTFDPSDVIAFVGPASSGGVANPYYGKPGTGETAHEPFVFVNFYNTEGTFDKIVFKQTTGAGYESDNHTVGWYTDQGGTVVPAVPEPSTWALMILGFGAVGGMMRANRRKTQASLKFA
ncbi:MAG TPA: PEPxxWA-CTERM sorting domain-containing protein [Croceibacterium sp.]|nr:PEPxxWA-CTERM sorting domain-containing protein [Croceibacterium sp.]